MKHAQHELALVQGLCESRTQEERRQVLSGEIDADIKHLEHLPRRGWSNDGPEGIHRGFPLHLLFLPEVSYRSITVNESDGANHAYQRWTTILQVLPFTFCSSSTPTGGDEEPRACSRVLRRGLELAASDLAHYYDKEGMVLNFFCSNISWASGLIISAK